MKRGILIIGRNNNYNIFEKEIDEDTRHAKAIQEYCENHGIQTEVPKDNLDGYLWGKAVAKQGDLVLQIEEDYVILSIPPVITNYQMDNFEVYIKDYLKKYASAFSYYNRGNKDIEIVIEEKDKNITWKLIYEDIQEKNSYFNEIEGAEDVQNIRNKR